MKLVDALRIIDGSHKKAYRVRYEFTDGKLRTFSCFPELASQKPEPPLDSLQYAIDLAFSFARNAPEGYRNIQVVYAGSGTPVDGARVWREDKSDV